MCANQLAAAMQDRGGDESGWEAGEGEMSSANHACQGVEPRRRWAVGCERRRQSLNLSCRASNVARKRRRRDPRRLKRKTPGRAFVRARHSILIPFSHKFARRQDRKWVGNGMDERASIGHMAREQ